MRSIRASWPLLGLLMPTAADLPPTAPPGTVCGTRLLSTAGWREHDVGAFTLRVPPSFVMQSAESGPVDSGTLRDSTSSLTYYRGPDAPHLPFADLQRSASSASCPVDGTSATTISLYGVTTTWPTHLMAWWQAMPGTDGSAGELVIGIRGNFARDRARLLTILSTVRQKHSNSSIISRVNSIARESTAPAPVILRSEFLPMSPSAPSVHASTIAETPDGFVAAWFGGSHEGANDVAIWLSRREGARWTAARRVATCHDDANAPQPCWNPVLFRTQDGILHLYYKAGPAPARWWGMEMRSRDEGRSWDRPTRLPDGILGPIKNKPTFTESGAIVSGSSTESVDVPSAWRLHFERSADSGRTWIRIEGPDATGIEAIQPTLVRYPAGLVALVRTRAGVIYETRSTDDGLTWTPLARTILPNPNSGIDAASDGPAAPTWLVYNHTREGRSPLNLAVRDGGKTWYAALVLERDPGEFSYPAVVVGSDERLYLTYTWNRRNIRFVILDVTATVRRHPITSGAWPLP